LRFWVRPQGGLAFIFSSDLVLSFPNLATSLDKICFASYLIEITDGLIGEGEENRLVFEHLKHGLGYLNGNDPSLRFLTSFELKLLSLVGYQPWLEGCKRCAKAHHAHALTRWHFSPRDGGILCERCSRLRKETLPLGAQAVEVLTELQGQNSLFPARRSLPVSVVREIRSVVVRFIQFHMEREIKSAPFLHRFASV
jgi:DNA repair protein RecO (recombination protein O)